MIRKGQAVVVMNNPLVSIVVPVYNNEKYIKKCIQSIINQSYHNLQIIIVNDGSTDDSGCIINEYAADDTRITLINQENSGVSAARNIGILKAEGEYLTFIDGDDYVSVDYIENLVACAVENSADMVITGITMVNTDESVIKEIVPGEYVRFEHEEWTFRLSAVAAHMYVTELWRRYNVSFYEGERGEDMPISLFFAGVCERISILKKADYYYVQHQSSAMHTFRKLDKSYLPYNALENTIIQLNDIGIKNSREFHELFVLRILATMIDIARGAGNAEIKELSDYISRIIRSYFPNCGRNPYIKLSSKLDIPLSQRFVVRILIMAEKTGLMTPLIKLVCR